MQPLVAVSLAQLAEAMAILAKNPLDESSTFSNHERSSEVACGCIGGHPTLPWLGSSLLLCRSSLHPDLSDLYQNLPAHSGRSWSTGYDVGLGTDDLQCYLHLLDWVRP